MPTIYDRHERSQNVQVYVNMDALYGKYQTICVS